MGPVVTFAREVDPFGVSEFVTHKVEVAVVGSGESDEACHFMEGDAAVDDEITGTGMHVEIHLFVDCLLYTSPSPRDGLLSRMPSSA